MLSGKVVARFVIGRNGKVSNAAIDRSSTIPDSRVAECVVSAFYDIEFPEPDGGIVTVVYPIMLSPGYAWRYGHEAKLPRSTPGRIRDRSRRGIKAD